MHFPKYWAWGEFEAASGRSGAPLKCGAWGWSDVSEGDAREHGITRAKRSFDTLQRNPDAAPSPNDPYLYGDGRPFRELVLEELAGGDVVISRNRIGCDVLNTATLGFVDVDYEGMNVGGGGGLFGLFKKGPKLTPEQRAREKALALLQTWLTAHPGDNFRIYETAAGLRYMLTSRELEPNSAEALQMLKALGSDRRYTLLCQAQKCFRARLTPKPWRAMDSQGNWERAWVEPDPIYGATGVPYPPAGLENLREIRAETHQKYRDNCSAYATCKFVGTIGSGEVLPAYGPLIALHDERTRAESGLPLA